MRIVVVGPCRAGKTVLVQGLRGAGYGDVIDHPQEHIGPARRNTWEELAPDVLVYLDAAFSAAVPRKPHPLRSDVRPRQEARLESARREADIYIDTTTMGIGDVLRTTLAALEGVRA